MHTFDYIDTPRRLLTPDIVKQLSALHEFKARQDFWSGARKDVLAALLNVARIQSTQASNQIEGIFTSTDRLRAIVMQKAEPQGRSEQEIAGYRDVLNTIHEQHAYIPVHPSGILQLHRDLYSFSGSDRGGAFKPADNVIAERASDGSEHIRFQPTPAFQTRDAMDALCDAYNAACARGDFDPLLLSAMFVLDFLCIHPFSDGNGRMSRLLTLLTLYRSGYNVGKYIGLEMLIEQSKEAYYAALQASSTGWHENGSDYAPFVQYQLGVLLRAYREFEERAAFAEQERTSKTDRVKAVFDRKVGKITKADIAEQCPRRQPCPPSSAPLTALVDAGYIDKVDAGPATGYVKR